MSAGSDVSPGLRTGAAVESVQERQKTIGHQKMVQQKTNVYKKKFECCGSYGQLPTERNKSL
jgi:hypothetical protein